MKRKLKLLFIVLIIGIVAGMQTINAEGEDEITVTKETGVTVVAGTDDTYEVNLKLHGDTIVVPDSSEQPADVVLFMDLWRGGEAVEDVELFRTETTRFAKQLFSLNKNSRIAILINTSYEELNQNGFANLIVEPKVLTSFTSDLTVISQSMENITGHHRSATTAEAIKAADELFTTQSIPSHKKVFLELHDLFPWDANKAYANLDKLLAKEPELYLRGVLYGSDPNGYNESYIRDLVARNPGFGAYYHADRDDLTQVLGSIYDKIERSVETIDVHAQIPNSFEVVPGSLQVSNNVVVDNTRLEKENVLSVKYGKLKKDEEISITYKLKIKQGIEPVSNWKYEVNYTFLDASGSVNSTKIDLPISTPVYKVVTATDGNAKISTSRNVVSGASYNVTWNVNSGYTIKSVLLNSNAIKPTTDNSLVLENIQADQNVYVSTSQKFMAPATGDTIRHNGVFWIVAALISIFIIVRYRRLSK